MGRYIVASTMPMRPYRGYRTISRAQLLPPLPLVRVPNACGCYRDMQSSQHSVNIPYASDESESSSRRTPHLRSCACTGRQCRRTRPRRMNSRWAPSPATESCRRTCRWRRGTSLLVVRPALRTPVRLAELGKSIRVASRPAIECRRSVRSQCKAASHGHVLIRRCRSPKPLRSSRRGAILVSEMRGLKS